MSKRVRKNNGVSALSRRMSKKDATLQKLIRDVEEAREQVRRGEYYTLDEIKALYGLQ